MKKLIIPAAFALAALPSAGQEVDITAVRLPHEIGITEHSYVGSRMRFEGEKIYIPSSDGILALDMNNPEADTPTSQGFAGENLIECVRNGDEWLAITRNQNMRLLLRSNDNGATVEDCTPYSLFEENRYRTAMRLCQDPANPQVVYLLSSSAGVLKSSDFGQTWTAIVDGIVCNETYCGFEIHPLDSDILLQHGENFIMEPVIQISYDGGGGWIDSMGYPEPDITLPDHIDYGENCIHDVAFHTTDINTWVYGGEGVIAKTTDGGRTWEHKGESWAYQYCTLYDSRNQEVVYSLGMNTHEGGRKGWLFMISSDGGETWSQGYHHLTDTPWYCDMKQTDDSLIILGTENIYFVKKDDLLKASGIQDITVAEGLRGDSNLYSVDGRLIKRDATDVDLRSLPRGLYIHHGRKLIIR